MPLTKPRCAKCDYNLKGIHHSLDCPECGHPDRALLFDGRSKALDKVILGIPLVMGLSLVVMVTPWLFGRFVPQGKHLWFLDIVGYVKTAMIGALFITGTASPIYAYAVMIRAVTNHDLTPIKSIQIVITITLGAGAIIFALLWV